MVGGKVRKELDHDHERSTTRGFVITRNFIAAKVHPSQFRSMALLVCDLLNVLSVGRMKT